MIHLLLGYVAREHLALVFSYRKGGYMGWRLKKAKSGRGWYLLKITDHGQYKDKNGKIKSKRPSESISDPIELLKLKFNPNWNYSEAKKYYDTIFKAGEAQDRRQTRIKAALDKIKDDDIVESRFLPKHLVKKFYDDFLMDRFCINPKEKELPKGYLIKVGCKEDEIVFDFFAGSGTTGEATIVFTHDISFVTMIEKNCLEKQVKLHMISMRNDNGQGEIKEDSPWNAKKVDDRISF